MQVVNINPLPDNVEGWDGQQLSVDAFDKAYSRRPVRIDPHDPQSPYKTKTVSVPFTDIRLIPYDRKGGPVSIGDEVLSYNVIVDDRLKRFDPIAVCEFVLRIVRDEDTPVMCDVTVLVFE